MRDREVTECSQHGLTRGESCLTNLVVLYERMTALVKKGRAMDLTYVQLLIQSLQNILVPKLERHGFDGWPVQ